MHNNIMAAGSRDRPPMLATGRYAQWRSRFLRCINTRPNGDALRKCILQGPYTPTTLTIPVVPATNNAPAVPEQTTVETILNMSPENKAHFESKKEAIHLLLTGIRDEIYSTVDACKTTHEMQRDRQTNHTPSESGSDEDNDPEQAQKDKEMQNNLALIAKYFKKLYKPTNINLRTSSNSRNKNVDTTPKYKNDNQTRQSRNQRIVNVVGARETVGSKDKLELVDQLLRAYSKPCLCKDHHWLADTNEEIDEQELKARYSYMAKIQEVPIADSEIDTEPLEQEDSNVTSNSSNMSLDSEENKKILKQLKKANASLTQELNECKSKLEESYTSRDSCLIALQNKQTELEKYIAFNVRTIDYDKLQSKLNKTLGLSAQKDIDIKEGLKLKAYKILVVKEKNDEEIVNNAWVKHTSDRFRALTALDMEVLIKTCLIPLSIKTQNDSFRFVHELKQEMHEDFKYVESLEKEIDELEFDKADFSNIYDLLLQECVSKDVMCSYLHSLSDLDAHSELQCLYLHKVKECECLAHKLSKQTESVSKEVYNGLLRSFAKLEKHSISLELALQQCQEQMKNDTVCKEKASNIRKQAVRNMNVIKPGMYKIATSSTQTRAPQLPQTSRNTNSRVSRYRGVNHITNVSRPQLKSTQVKDKVMPYYSQVTLKKTDVEEHPRIFNISKKTKSVTACNDSLNSRTLNVKAVYATCGKCVFNLNHDACVSKYRNDVNARTKKPSAVPISARKPKNKANKYVATPLRKTVASDTTIQQYQSYFRKLYENTNKAWKW
nr:hypothetical protein [Tanacetum cinerariifolium]